MHPIKRPFLCLSLLFLSAPVFAQMDSVYIQTEENGTDNGYPMILLAGQQWGLWAEPIIEKGSIGSWTSDGSTTTFTLSTGTTAMVAGDEIEIRNFPGVPDNDCVVSSVPDSTHFSFHGFNCSSSGGTYNSAGSGTVSGVQYWKKDGLSDSVKGTWEIIDHGTLPGKYFIQDHTLTLFGGGSPCTPDLHQSTCYVSHPSIANADPAPRVYIQLDPSIVPTCNQSGSIINHNLVLSSDWAFTLRFTTTQGSKVGEREFIVCKPGLGTAKLAYPHWYGGYEQYFVGDVDAERWSVFANVDQYGIVSLIQSVPGTGDAYIETQDAPAGDGYVKNGGKLPQVIFHAGTVKGAGYILRVCADADPTSCTDKPIYVTHQDKVAANPDLMPQPQACEEDPRMTAAGGSVYNIGPGQTYTDLADPTLPTWNYLWGSTFIIHGTMFHNYAEWKLPTNYTSHLTDEDVPSINICGVQNVDGSYPKIDGTNATASSNIGGFTGNGNLITVNGIPVTLPSPDVWGGGPQYFHGIRVAGLYLQNARPGIYHYPPGQTTGTEDQWGLGAAIRPFAIENYSFAGNHINNVSNGILTDNNAQAGWQRGAVLDGRIHGNHFEGYGVYGQSTEHASYMQDDRGEMDFNLFDGSVSDQATGCFSMRGTRMLFINNRCVGKQGVYYTPNGWGGNSEIQDASFYFMLNGAFGPTANWDGVCGNGSTYYPFCSDPGNPGMTFGGITAYAAWAAEHWDSMFMVGNAFQAVSGANGGCGMSIAPTHYDNGLELQHNLYFSYNLDDCPNAEAQTGAGILENFRATPEPSGNSVQPIDWPGSRWINSVYWWDNNLPPEGYRSAFGRTTSYTIFQTNLFHTGQFSPAQTNIPVLYGGDGFNASPYGITQATVMDQWSGMFPVEAKFGGWSPSQFIFSDTKPYNATTLKPDASSPLVGQATALPYPASLYPPIFNPPDAGANIVRRTSLSTIGPYDPTPSGVNGTISGFGAILGSGTVR